MTGGRDNSVYPLTSLIMNVPISPPFPPEQKLQARSEVLAELMEEHLAIKKALQYHRIR